MSDNAPTTGRRGPESTATAATTTSSDWKVQKAPSTGGQVKLALMLVMTLSIGFIFVVYRKFDSLKGQLVAAETNPAEGFRPLEESGGASEEVVLDRVPHEEGLEPVAALAPPENFEPLWEDPASAGPVASTQATSEGVADPFPAEADPFPTASADRTASPGEMPSPEPAVTDELPTDLFADSRSVPGDPFLAAGGAASEPQAMPSVHSSDEMDFGLQPRAASAPVEESDRFLADSLERQAAGTGPAANEGASDPFPSAGSADTQIEVREEPSFAESDAGTDTAPAVTEAQSVPGDLFLPPEETRQPAGEPEEWQTVTTGAATSVAGPPVTGAPGAGQAMSEPPLLLTTVEAASMGDSAEPTELFAPDLPDLPEQEMEPQPTLASTPGNSGLFAEPEPVEVTETVRTGPPETYVPETRISSMERVKFESEAANGASSLWEPESDNGGPAGGVSTVETELSGPLTEETYTVRPGDNYWRISRQFYGTGRYFSALTEHNREAVPTPERMRPGMTVRIPPRAFLEENYSQVISGQASTSLASAEEVPVRVAKSTNGGFFVAEGGVPMYRVGDGDTLTGISQRHLGRASRWEQIYGLNKDVLPSPEKLRPGMLLRLPDDASHVALTPDVME